MSGVVHAIFGGGDSKSSSQSSSQNLAYPGISTALAPAVQGGVNTFNNLTDQLGQGFDAFKKNSGFDFMLNRGQNNIVGAKAANGLLNSGSTSRSLAQYESGLGSQTYNNYLDRLQGASQTGIAAASPIVSAGYVSNSSGTGNSQDYGKGILGTLFG